MKKFHFTEQQFLDAIDGVYTLGYMDGAKGYFETAELGWEAYKNGLLKKLKLNPKLWKEEARKAKDSNNIS